MIEEDIEAHTFRMKLSNLSRAIDELRHLSYKVRRLKTLQGDLPKQDIDVIEVLRQLADGCRSQLPGLRIDFVFPEEPVIIPFNRDAFKDALDEVFQNACREFREHNTEAPHLILRVENSDSQVEISITDNALPVNHALIERPFEEDASTYTRSGKGSGLGLFNVRETFRIVAGECRLTENRDPHENRLPGVCFTVRIDIHHNS
jgi:signal transduction histidine kinase